MRRPKSGFYNPPPMLTRYPSNKKHGGSTAYGGSNISRSDYSTLQQRHQQVPSSLSHAASQQSEML